MQQSTSTPTAVSKDERNWAMFAHMSGFLVFLTGIGGIVGPLVIYLLKKDEMPFVEDQAREALNFQITMFIGALICFALMWVLIGFLLIFLLGIFDIVFTIVAAVKASEGVA